MTLDGDTPEETTTETRVLWAIRYSDGAMSGALYTADTDDPGYAERTVRFAAEGSGGEVVTRTETITRTQWTVAP